MRIRVDIDPKVLEEIKALTGKQDTNEAVIKALEEYVRQVREEPDAGS